MSAEDPTGPEAYRLWLERGGPAAREAFIARYGRPDPECPVCSSVAHDHCWHEVYHVINAGKPARVCCHCRPDLLAPCQ